MRILTILVDAKRIDEWKCDDITRQYNLFLQNEVTHNLGKFSTYSSASLWLDDIMNEFTYSENYPDLCMQNYCFTLMFGQRLRCWLFNHGSVLNMSVIHVLLGELEYQSYIS